MRCCSKADGIDHAALPIFDPRFDESLGRYPYNPVLQVNPLNAIENFDAPEDVTRFVGGFEAQFRPFSNFSVRYLAGIDDYRREVLFLQPPLSINANFTGSVQAPVQVTIRGNWREFLLLARRQMVATNGSQDLVRSILEGEETRRRHASLRWGTVLVVLAIGFAIVEAAGWTDVTPGVFAVLLGATGLGNLVAWFAARRLG